MTANILVVDDLEANIRLLEAKLKAEYYTVYTASSGKIALEILQSKKIDLILLDIMMPNMDGFEVCKAIKADINTSHIPVIMVTALSEIEDRVKGLQEGADEFLTKPINDTALFARVKSLTRMKLLIDELKIRNKTNELLGVTLLEINDNFNKNILLIDDDVSQSKQISTIVSRLASKIKIISNQEELAIYEKSPLFLVPDLIIISCHLENWDALRACVNFKSQDIYKYTVLMMLTEDDPSPMVIKGLELGVNDYFVYPVDDNELIARIRTQLRRKKYQDELRNSLEESVNLSIKDGLTNVYNRRYLDIHITQMIKIAADNKNSLCLMMFDIDDFKKVNDVYGHVEGDEVLKIFTSILKSSLRVTDLIGRYGGEEFAVLLGDTSLENATTMAERVRINIEQAKFELNNKQAIKKTTSIGVTKYKYGESSEDFFGRADAALYKAKNSGKNKVIITD